MCIRDRCEAVILGAVGGPKYDNLDFSKRPERALLKLRKELKLFANLRPAICFKQLVDSSTLKPEVVSGLDIMIVRELTGGIYFGEPRGIEPIENNQRKGINTHSYTCLLYTSPSPRDATLSRMPSSA